MTWKCVTLSGHINVEEACGRHSTTYTYGVLPVKLLSLPFYRLTTQTVGSEQETAAMGQARAKNLSIKLLF